MASQEESLEYLELRCRLKEDIRKKMKKNKLGSSINKALPFNYGSFFGPSQPAIAQRVIQESKSLFENPTMAAKSGSTKSNNAPKVTNELKSKVQMLKDSRDYSFLLSDDDAQRLPAPSKAAGVTLPPSNQQYSSNTGRKLLEDGEVIQKPIPRNKLVALHKPKPTLSKLQPSTEIPQSGKSKVMPTQANRQKQAAPPSNARKLKRRRDGAEAISMIRKMFGYNPNKYQDDDDTSDMEANFNDILREEKQSAKIAMKEDQEELRKIEEQERRERLRRQAKKRKLQMAQG
ncbi:putative protein RMD5 -like protein A-like [Capsicum annuum]|nr:putative protein RMD5 -like protein A-like [Capsicum annuum]KAF3650633.1 putative protein RMD5 -like protein A-like [Capsicum annuum]